MRSTPARQVAVMNDIAPPASRPMAAGAESLIGAEGEPLIERLVPQLPDATRFLERYLRQAVRVRVDAAGLEIGWTEGNNLGRRMIERPENCLAIETTLARLTGRPMRVRSVVLGAAPPAPAPTSRRSMPTMPPEPVDPPPSRAPLAAAEDEAIAETAESDDEGDEREASTPMTRPAAAPLPNPTAVPAPPIDRRSAREKAQSFLDQGGEAVRRAKMLREMFHGRPIDEQGQPISIHASGDRGVTGSS